VLHAADDARNLLRGVQVLIIGESFQRKIWQGLAVVLSNDYEQGALDRTRFRGKNWQNCLWGKAFSVKECAKTRNMIRNPVPGLQPGALQTYINVETIRRLEPLCSPECLASKNWSTWPRADVLVVGLGLHDKGRQFPKVTWAQLATLMDTQVIAPLGRLLAAAPARRTGATTRRRVVWMPLQSQGSKKPKQFQGEQNNGAITPFNVGVAEAAARAGLEVFDTFNITAGAYSYDGTHFGMTVNVLRAHLLLNIIATSIST
jgi:hypothetical protein